MWNWIKWFFGFEKKVEATLDVNKDGQINKADAKAAADKVEEVVKQVETEIKAVVAETVAAKEEVVKTVKTRAKSVKNTASAGVAKVKEKATGKNAKK